MKGILKEFKIFKNLFTFFIIVLLLNCNLDKTDADPVLIGKEAKWLKYNAVEVSQISPFHTDFSDLQPLKTAISDSRIVMLGEQSHGDGSTFLAKVRLIKFLHQEMGFDVVAFESGLYDCHKVWLDILYGDNALYASRTGVYEIWSRCREVEPLFEYINSVSHGPNFLEIAGFDFQFTANSRLYLVEDLEKFLYQNNGQILKNKRWSLFKEVLQNLINSEYYLPDEESKTTFYNILDAARNEIDLFESRMNPLFQSPAFWKQMLKSIRKRAERNWMIPYDNVAGWNIRDAQMADNLIWLYRNVYQGRKIIVWAATLHNMRNINEINTLNLDADYSEAIPMGHIAWVELRNLIYSIGFTGYKGTFYDRVKRRIINLPLSPEGSLEYFMNEAGFDFGIIDFRYLTDDGAWLRAQLISRPHWYFQMKADWTRMLDAMFFIRHMRHTTYRWY